MFKDKVYASYNVVPLPFPFQRQGLRPKYNLDPRSGALRDGFADEIVDEDEDEEGTKD